MISHLPGGIKVKYYNDVKAFHDKFGMVTPPSYVHIPTDLYEFRAKFFDEEFTEYVESFETGDLPTAIDSLIDLVYITMGTTLLHGISSDIYSSPNGAVFAEPQPTSIPASPKLLRLEEHHELKDTISRHISDYRAAYVRDSQDHIQQALNSLYYTSINAAQRMGFYQKRWDLLWDDVQRANMSKERAVRADQSKRGSTYDVFKPVGWVAPRTEELVEQMLRGEA